jgi:hypothetical protein
MATRTIELDRNDLDKSIEVLSSAGQEFQLTRFERIAYRSLMVSADVAMVSFLLCLPIDVLLGGFRAWGLGDPLGAQGLDLPAEQLSPNAFFALLVFGLLVLVFLAAILVGIISLVLSIPLLLKTFRENARLKQLGLSSLTRSLLKESQRGSWKSWVRRFLFFGALIYMLSDVSTFFAEQRGGIPIIGWGLYFTVVPGLIIAARYLRNQRERIELTASAEELRKAFQSLRQRSDTGVVSVPTELLEKTAKIEMAQIAKERKDAVLQSIGSHSKEYPVAFDRSAAEQRATLDSVDRIELEDLVEKLGADATELETQAGAGAGVAAALRAATKSKRVQIDYLIDHVSHRIRITAVRQGVSGSQTSPSGASHA